jgi:NADPH:quinone reductase-like Zn-dependent oxidoreductase
MKAAQITQYGDASQIKVVDIDKPVIKPGQVLVAVYAASINPFDTKIREGVLGAAVKLPITLGGDIAGEVVEVSEGVTSCKVGDKVYGQANAVAGNSGAFADYAATAASQIGLMPDTIDFRQAAALPLTGVSALQVINQHMKLQAGQKILIHGGAGGIGTMAIQIAKHIGAYVATTATGDGLAYVKDLGADEVLDYKTQQFDELLSDYDAVFDTVGGQTYERSFKVLKKGGIVVSMLEQPNEALMQQFGAHAEYQQTRITTTDLDTLTALVTAGVVTAHVDAVYVLEQIREAFEAREAGAIRGKVVIDIRPQTAPSAA